MNIEKAIETLKDMRSIFGERSHNQYSLPALDLAISALEKQIPKKIIYDYGLNETRCPRCNTIFGYAYEEDETEDMYYAPYCYECGQCLDWEVENE